MRLSELQTQFEQNLIDAQQAFAALTGLDPRRPLTVPEPKAAPDDVEGAIERAQTGRADLVAARHMARSAKFQRQAKTWEWAPVIDGVFVPGRTVELARVCGRRTFMVRAPEGLVLGTPRDPPGAVVQLPGPAHGDAEVLFRVPDVATDHG